MVSLEPSSPDWITNAASAAARLTTEALVAEVREEEKMPSSVGMEEY
jgi:hypothetical protein